MSLPLQIVQIIYDRYDVPISGADLRNDMVKICLEHLGEVCQIATGTRALDRGFLAKISAWAAGGDKDPDLIVAEGVWLLDHALAWRDAFPNARVICDFHNVESLLLREQNRIGKPAFARFTAPIRHGWAWRAATALDRRAIAQCDAIWAASHIDAARARTLAPVGDPVSIHVIPNAVPFRAPAPARMSRGDILTAPRLLFLGHLGYPPNVAAVAQLAKRIMPSVSRLLPDARLVVAGRNPNARVRDVLANMRAITLVADPADVAPLYAEADLVIVPLNEGGGSRIKILEALFLGVPVIASAKAVEGLDLVAGTHFVLADGADMMAKAVRDLCRDPVRRTSLSALGRSFVLDHHTRPAVLQAVMQAVADLSAP